MWYVYALVDPRNDLMFFIGRSESMGITPYKNPNPIKDILVRAIKSSGHRVKVKVLASFKDEEAARTEERRLILGLGRLVEGTGILTNIGEDTGMMKTSKTRKKQINRDLKQLGK